MEADELPSATVARVTTRLDAASSPALELALLPLLDGSRPAVLLDLSRAPYVSSAGLRVVLVAAKQARAKGVRFGLFGLSPSVRIIFETPGFLKIIPAYDSEDAALAASSSG